MKLFTALLGTETNTFSPFLTGWKNFESTYLVRNGDHQDPPNFLAIPLVQWRKLAEKREWTIVESLATFAMPAGITLDAVYESLRDELLADLESALPVDGVLLAMHGAMVAQGYDDCEGDLLQRVRQLVGPDVPIGVELDLHCHISEAMITNANAIVTFKEYPHIDPGERAVELFEIIAQAMLEGSKPITSVFDCHMIGVYHTSYGPVKDFVARMKSFEGSNGILSVSLAHGFPWGDVADLGTKVLVVTNGDSANGERLAKQLGEEFYAMRESVQPDYKSIDEAIDLAIQSNDSPVVLADVSDNSGGGAPNDSTFILARLLERNIGNAAVGGIWDPVAVSMAVELGVGVTSDFRIGGKMGPSSGDPIDVNATVTAICLDASQRFGDASDPLGDCVALKLENNIEVVLISQRSQTFHPDLFENVGVRLESKDLIVVKSMQHFYAGFSPIASSIEYVAAPGALVPDIASIPYQHARRSLWPITQ